VDDDGVLDRLLAADRAAAAELVAALAGDLDRMIQASAGTNADDEHDPEGATIAFERAQLASLLAAAQQRLADLDRAIGRSAHGSYGRCQACGRPIPADRLRARPAAATCLDCAATRGR
jgi:DnaK suppressor protein